MNTQNIWDYITDNLAGGVATDLYTAIFGCLGLILIWVGYKMLCRMFDWRRYEPDEDLMREYGVWDDEDNR